MSNPPKIVIVTPSFNQGHLLEKTIKSVIGQNYENLSYFVIDGKSQDNSINVIHKYEDQLSGWISEPDAGQSNAINKGWQMEREADIYAWINSDDYLLPGCLVTIAEAYEDSIKSKENVGVFAGSGLKVNLQGKTVKTVDVKKITKHCPRTAFQFLQSSAFFTGNAIQDFGMLNESLTYTMDWEFVLRINKKYKIKYIDSLLSAQRVYDQTKTSTGGWARLREIAMVGQAYNGKTDRNFLLYKLYSGLLSNKNGLQRISPDLRKRIAVRTRSIIDKMTYPRSHMIHW